MSESMRCPHKGCKGHVMQKSRAGGVKLRLKGHINVDEQGLHASCYWCGGSVTLPIELQKAVVKDRFFIGSHPEEEEGA